MHWRKWRYWRYRHAKNHSALSALFALLQVKVQKVQIVQCKKMHEILETIETVRKKVSQESQLSHAKIYTENCEKSENSHFSQCKILYRRHSMPGNGRRMKKRGTKVPRTGRRRKTATRWCMAVGTGYNPWQLTYVILLLGLWGYRFYLRGGYRLFDL